MALPSPQDRAYLSVITWPDGLSRQAQAELLTKAAGLDLPTMLLRVGQDPPAIMAVTSPAAARAAVKAVIQRGGDAFAPTLADLTALGPTLKIKDLRLDSGRLAIDLWRGPSLNLRPRELEIIIRAQLRRPHPQAVIPGSMSIAAEALVTPAFGGLAGAAGLAQGIARFYGLDLNADPPATTFSSSNKLDLHTIDGRVLQVDGDKFGFRILGDMRGLSDAINVDRLCELLTHLHPELIVDPYFSLWRAPAECRTFSMARAALRDEDPSFAMYSRWAALMYRQVMSRPAR